MQMARKGCLNAFCAHKSHNSPTSFSFLYFTDFERVNAEAFAHHLVWSFSFGGLKRALKVFGRLFGQSIGLVTMRSLIDESN